MNRSRRLSSLFFTFLGAVSVGLVVAVLAVSGVFDRTERVVTAAPAPRTTTVAAAPAADGSVADIYATASPAVAFVQSGSATGASGSGSGFLIDVRGHVVTNQHVVDGSTEFTIRFGEDGKAIDAKLVGQDASTDLAVLEVDPAEVPAETEPLELATGTALRPGDAAIAIGSPFGLSGTVTTGIISALDREITSPNGFDITGVLQTDAAINPGNSGGPLLDADGRVIGVNSQIASSAQQNSGVGFAVPVETVSQVVPQLLEGGEIERAFLGVSSTVDADEPGAVVATIAADGPAGDSELRLGDRITAIEGEAVKAPTDLSAAVLERKPGETIKLKVERDGEERTIEVRLGTRPDQLAQG